MSPNYNRWYDYDPVLVEVINLLKDYQTELKAQAEIFLKEIEKKVSKEAIDKFYEMVRPKVCNRWYDKDPIISRTIELLRVVPPEVQNATAKSFLKALQDMGVYKKETSN